MRVGKKRHLRQKRAENAEQAEIADDDRVHAAALRAQGKSRGLVQLVLADGDVEREICAAAADAAVADNRFKFTVRNVLRPAAKLRYTASAPLCTAAVTASGDPAGASSSTIISSS